MMREFGDWLLSDNLRNFRKFETGGDGALHFPELKMATLAWVQDRNRVHEDLLVKQMQEATKT